MPRRTPRSDAKERTEKPSIQSSRFFGRDLLSAIDESPELCDPYSDLNIFLSKKVKQEMHHCPSEKKWSVQLQDQLIHRIAPEFKEKFPGYRLGVSALKKTWEKVQFYSTQIQSEKEALTQDGKLNLPFFIKENLKSTAKQPKTCHIHPCHYAHQLAVKMSECIAVVDGIRPKLDQLTRTIWSLQRHLIPSLSPEHFKSPYDENEKVDKLIVRAILEITSNHPEISQAELAFYTRKRLIQLQSLTSQYTSAQIKKMLWALFADICHHTSERMERTLERIPYPVAKCLKNELAAIAIDSPDSGPEQVTEEAFSFFEKASGALADIESQELERKIQNWTIQSDMHLRWIRLMPYSALRTEIRAQWRPGRDLFETVESVYQRYLEQQPKLLGFAKDVKQRIWIYLKHLWYTEAFDDETPTYDRFIKWHKELMRRENLTPQQLIDRFEKLCKRMLPLMPFHRARTQTLLFTEEEDRPYKDHRDAQDLPHTEERPGL